jgi:hypothetical protein
VRLCARIYLKLRKSEGLETRKLKFVLTNLHALVH